MSVLFIALPIAVLLGAAGLFGCIYCIRGGQYDDLETPAVRILVDQQRVEDDSDQELDRSPDRTNAQTR